jgi:hypothetical protein
MSALELPTAEEVEKLLYREAALRDAWHLEEWLELLTGDAVYQVPPTDIPEGDARNTLFIIADDAVRIRSRVKQLLGKSTWAEIRIRAHAGSSATYAFSALKAKIFSSLRISLCSGCVMKWWMPTSAATNTSSGA